MRCAVTNVPVSLVRSFGTEDRPVTKHIPPRNETYEFIIFRGSDIKDLHVSDVPKQDELPQDPAILSAVSRGVGVAPTVTYPLVLVQNVCWIVLVQIQHGTNVGYRIVRHWCRAYVDTLADPVMNWVCFLVAFRIVC